jgi:hypothetical protein
LRSSSATAGRASIRTFSRSSSIVSAKGNSSPDKRYGGLGLGLSIVRHLTELHGGTVEAANAEEGGALFTVRLPVMAVKQTLSDTTERATRQRGIERRSFVRPSARSAGIKVLAVDDEGRCADAAHRNVQAVRSDGRDMRFGGRGDKAYRGVRPLTCSFRTSVMPGEDGYSLIKKVREAEKKTGGRLPAVALTAVRPHRRPLRRSLSRLQHARPQTGRTRRACVGDLPTG